MMKKKLSELYVNSPLFGVIIIGSAVGYPVYYAEYADLLDREFVRTYGDYYYVNNSVTNENDLLKAFQSDVRSFLFSNDYKYGRLWNTTMLTYDPIENYSMKEEITVEYSGEENTNNIRTGSVVDELTKTGDESISKAYTGEESMSKVYTGEESNVNTRSGNSVEELERTGSEVITKAMSGSEKATDTFNGSESTQNVIGESTTTSTNAVSADDSLSYSPNEQTQNISNAHTDTSTRTYNGRSNVKELEFTNREDIDTTTFDGRKDTNTTTYNNITDSSVKSFTGRNDTETTSFNNRKDTETTSFNDRKDTNTTTYNNITDSNIKSFNGRKDKTSHTRSGNIGVTTSQQMLQSEREIAMFSFWNALFKDIATEILFYYDCEVCGEWL